MNQVFRGLVAVGSICLCSSMASAGLLTNGSFEDDPGVVGEINGNTFGSMAGAIGTNSWDVWDSLPGWSTGNNLAGSLTNGIEVQTTNTINGGGMINPRPGGDYYVELDSHDNNGLSNSTMFQQVYLDPGVYELSFYYSPRTSDPATNGINAYVQHVSFGTPISASSVWLSPTVTNGPGATPPNVGEWTLVTREFQIVGAGNYYVSLAATGVNETLGGFVDDVDLELTDRPSGGPQIPTPEPGSFAVFAALSIAGLGIRRRRNG